MKKYDKLSIFLIKIISDITGIIWSGFVLSILWQWFISDLFNVKILTIPMAIGVHLIISFMTETIATKLQEQDQIEFIAQQMSTMLTKPLIALIIGWVTTYFI